LFEWTRLITEVDRLDSEKLSFLFVFHPKDTKELQMMFKRNKMTHPVFIDDDNAINQLNHFPEQELYQCFLLDKDNKVVMIGNPTLNPIIWELYKKQIWGIEETTKAAATTVEIDKTAFDFGNIRLNTKNTAVFTIKNTGNTLLVINQVSASCGCTTVEWDKQPIAARQTTEIKVIMNPEETGHFNKTIEVFCNIKESPIKLTVSGKTNN
jgi:hypothetical protein